MISRLKSNHPFTIVLNTMVIFSMLFILLSFSLTNDKSNSGLKGKVRSMTHIDYQVIWDSIIEIRLSNKDEMEFDKEGKGTISKRYYTANMWQDSSIAEYDHKGLLIGEKYYSRFKLDSFFLIRSMAYQYDSLRRKIELDQTAIPPNKSFKIVYTYDANGKLAETKIYNADGTSRNTETIKGDSAYKKYDAKGNIIEKGSISHEGYKHIFKYDKSGSLIKYETYNPDGSIDTKHILGVDKHYNEFDSTYFGKGGVDVTINKFTYDKVGNWIIDSTFENDTRTYIRTQQFEYY